MWGPMAVLLLCAGLAAGCAHGCPPRPELAPVKEAGVECDPRDWLEALTSGPTPEGVERIGRQELGPTFLIGTGPNADQEQHERLHHEATSHLGLPGMEGAGLSGCEVPGAEGGFASRELC